jgi:solute:Na+ symporter, SSS family
MQLPGMAVLFGGVWIGHLNYWGCNQYITQRALGADLRTARNGILFAAFLKMLMPVLVVLPGIAAYALYSKGHFQAEMLGADGTLNADKAYPVLLNLLPAGLKGLSFAALTAAVVASLAGKANSIATIFTLDIFKKYIGKNTDEKSLVRLGRWVIVVSMVLAIVVSPYMGIDKKGGFQFIQEMSALLSPGIVAAFLMGFFWKRSNSAGAFFAIVGGFLIALCMHNNFFPFADWSQVPFIDRMSIVFLICVGVMFLLGLVLPDEGKGIPLSGAMFIPHKAFTVGAILILALIAFLYTYFW